MPLFPRRYKNPLSVHLRTVGLYLKDGEKTREKYLGVKYKKVDIVSNVPATTI